MASAKSLPGTRKAMRLNCLAIALILLSPIAFIDVSYAAGRVFYDGFEDGTASKWANDSDRNRCPVVSLAIDRVVGPRSGSRMLQCNWNGTVVWSQPNVYEALVLPSWSYSSEILIRFWIRTDRDFGGLTGPKFMRIGSDSSGATYSFMGMHVGAGLTADFYTNTGSSIGNTYWGAGSRAANGAWHKIEVYIKHNSTSGVMRLWEDGTLLWQAVNVNTVLNWRPFHISSNWSGAAGCCDHDASNHIYWDEFEIYSDTGTGGVGNLSDATITTSGGGGTIQLPPAPQNLQVR
jgi:hypothetical protein